MIKLNGPIFSHGGEKIYFSAQELKSNLFEEKYEQKIYLSGAVSTRPNNWHDFFNALVWMTFPKTKAAINKRHYLALKQQEGNQQKNRSPLQDLLTLFDESGAIVICSEVLLAEQLKQKKWKELFWQNRRDVISKMKFYLFGHALYEKALNPYQGMTGKCIILLFENNFFEETLGKQLQSVDESLAKYFSEKNESEIKANLSPLPLLGVPGWAIENEVEKYYEDKNYFRDTSA